MLPQKYRFYNFDNALKIL